MAGQETVELRLAVAPGDVLYYGITSTVQVTLNVPPNRREGRADSEGREAVRVLEVAANGVIHLETTLENLRVTSAGRTEERTPAPENQRVRPDGRILDLASGRETERYYFDLPGRPVRVGETWRKQTRAVEGQVTSETTQNFTLESIESSGDERVARIRNRIEGIATIPFTPLFPVGQLRGRGTVRGTEQIDWSLDRGRLVRYEIESTTELQVEIIAFGQSALGTQVDRIAVRRVLLPPDSVTAPAVAEEVLITPGRSIGATTLEMPVAEITGRLGPPSANAPDSTMWGADRGFRALVRNWRGLVGYTDPADEAKLVGLGIADRRFRSARGLGVGSAYGAVLFGHGMTPPRVEMRGAGAVTRVLIFNDQGIAFGFNADRTHPGTDGGPLGSVDWVIIFPVGGAGRIFTLP